MNEQRTKVFLDRYARKGEDGSPVETDPTQMFDRVASAIAATEAEDNAFRDLLDDFKFVPGGRILAGAGAESEVTFYNCYVIPVETRARRQFRSDYSDTPADLLFPQDSGSDSREAIIDTIGLMVDIMSRGGGVGINWSVLRPSGAHLQRINATSSGPIDWMHFASVAVGTVEQGGSRRGAAMFMLDDWHPDLLKFIDAKRDNSRITNANVSVAVSDWFMQSVENDGPWVFGFPDTTDPHYNSEWDGDANGWLAKGYGWKQYGEMPAREVWRKLTEAAHASGEPGVVFLDRYNKESTAQGVERLISVNPCGEQGLGAYSVCNLGAMNLDAYIRGAEGPTKTIGKGSMAIKVTEVYNNDGKRSFDYEAFARDVQTAVRFLDNVIDVNYYFIPENEKVQKNLRRIGLSVMGLADALAALGLRYGSQGAVEFTEAVFRTMKHAAIEASVELARTKGFAPAWDPAMSDRPYFADIPLALKEAVRKYGLRNLFLLTQAPTGTTSILAGVNSGIEPFFDMSYIRKDRTGEHRVRIGALEKYLHEGTYPGGEWVVANDVTVEEHIAMQAAVQKYVDSSVSKTINAPNSQTVEETAKAYELAYRSGLKGLAYYRDGSRDVQVLSHDKADTGTYKDDYVERLLSSLEAAEERVAELEVEVKDIEDGQREFTRPDVLKGETIKARTAAGTAYVTVNRDDKGEAREVFFNVGKAGSDITGLAEAMGRLASLALRKGATLGGVANQMEGVGGSGNFNRPLAAALGKALSDINRPAPTNSLGVPKTTLDRWSAGGLMGLPVNESPALGRTMVMGVDLAKDLRDFTVQVSPNIAYAGEAEEDYTVQQQEERVSPARADLCPECGNVTLIREEGCSKCHVCGYSAC